MKVIVIEDMKDFFFEHLANHVKIKKRIKIENNKILPIKENKFFSRLIILECNRFKFVAMFASTLSTRIIK